MQNLTTRQNMTRIIVVVSGGNVTSVFSSDKDISVEVLDYDNAEGVDNEAAEMKIAELNKRLEEECKELKEIY